MNKTDAIAAVEALKEVVEGSDDMMSARAYNTGIDRAIAAISALPDGWMDIEKDPPPMDEYVLAAARVVNNTTGAEWWDRHVICIDSETGDVNAETDAGWAVDDYTHWQPLPEGPSQ